MAIVRALLLAIFAALGAPLGAGVAGQEDPAFAAAVTDWLAGKEEAALQALAAQAQAGNSAARILLTLVDTTPAYHGDWLAGLPRDRRIALMRAPGGLSGQNWIDGEADPLARAWVALRDGNATAALVLEFGRLGEGRAAHMAARQLFIREKRGFGAIADDPAFPASLMPLAIRDWQRDDPARATEALAALGAGHPGRPLVGAGKPTPEALLAWAQAAPATARLLTTLRQLCPASPTPAEDLTAYLAQSGGFWALAWIGPPAESLIDPERYAQSPKAAEVMRHLLRSGALADPEAVAASACLQGLLGQ